MAQSQGCTATRDAPPTTGSLHGDGLPPTYLPAESTKVAVHDTYAKACEDAGYRSLGLSSFKNLWLAVCPHIKIMSPRSDVCPKCEQLRDGISEASGDEAKLKATSEFTAHLTHAMEEKGEYRRCCERAELEVTESQVAVGPAPPCSADLHHVHYTFDYSQCVTIPHHARQVGPLYFLNARKVLIFGVTMEGTKSQLNFLVDEDQTIGPDGTGCKGPNGVLSMLHHALTRWGLGEVAWRVLTGGHRSITLHTQVPYHGRCIVDSNFGAIKRVYRRYAIHMSNMNIKCDTHYL